MGACNPVMHVEIAVRDLDRASRFYAAWLQLQPGPVTVLHDSRMVMLPYADGAEGASLALAQGPTYQPGTQGARLYIGVDDVQASLQRACAAGAEVRFGPERAGALWVAEVLDSEGNLIALQAPAGD